MSTQQLLFNPVQRHREGKRAQIENYFINHLGEKVSSRVAHMKWGSSFRSRVSEVNRDKHSEVTICNEVGWTGAIEESVYWGIRR